MKKMLTSELVLQPFNVLKKTFLLTDASKLHGIGWALMQEDEESGKTYLVECGSQSLTDTQKRYAVIELEAMAIFQAIKKLRFYLQGCCFTVVTDHRPLVGIFRKPLNEIDNVRLLRYREALASFQMSVEWKAGRTHLIADALSRYPVFKEDSELDEVNTNLCNRLGEDPLFEPIAQDAGNDSNYQKLVSALRENKHPSTLPSFHPAQSYRNVWERLSLLESDDTVVVLDDVRLVVPERSRKEILRLLHLSHSGISKTRRQAQDSFYWPGMNNEILQLVQNCQQCVELLPSQARTPFVRDEASEPMEAVGSDLFFYKDNWLILVDRKTGYPWARKLRNRTDTKAVTDCLEAICLEYGLPKRIRTDGGPCFRDSFKAWCKKWNIKHELSSARNPESNGLAERAVKSIKHLLSKCLKEGTNFETALMHWRNAPRQNGFSPSFMFFGRNQRTLIPTLPRQDDLSYAEVARRDKVSSNEAYYNERARPLAPLNVGESVVIQNYLDHNRWNIFGFVKERREGSGDSYVIEADGTTYVRNRRFIRPRVTHPGNVTPSLESTVAAIEKEESNVQQPRRSVRVKERRERERSSTPPSPHKKRVRFE